MLDITHLATVLALFVVGFLIYLSIKPKKVKDMPKRAPYSQTLVVKPLHSHKVAGTIAHKVVEHNVTTVAIPETIYFDTAISGRIALESAIKLSQR